MTTSASIGTIDTAQALQYRTDGYLVVRGVFAADRIADLDAEAAACISGPISSTPTTSAAAGRTTSRPASAASTASIR